MSQTKDKVDHIWEKKTTNCEQLEFKSNLNLSEPSNKDEDNGREYPRLD